MGHDPRKAEAQTEKWLGRKLREEVSFQIDVDGLKTGGAVKSRRWGPIEPSGVMVASPIANFHRVGAFPVACHPREAKIPGYGGNNVDFISSGRGNKPPCPVKISCVVDVGRNAKDSDVSAVFNVISRT